MNVSSSDYVLLGLTKEANKITSIKFIVSPLNRTKISDVHTPFDTELSVASISEAIVTKNPAITSVDFMPNLVWNDEVMNISSTIFTSCAILYERICFEKSMVKPLQDREKVDMHVFSRVKCQVSYWIFPFAHLLSFFAVVNHSIMCGTCSEAFSSAFLTRASRDCLFSLLISSSSSHAI